MSQKHKEGNTHPSEKPKVFPEDRRQYLLIRAQKDLRNEEGKKHMELLSSHVPPSSVSNSRSLFFCTSFHLFPSLDWKAVNNKKKSLLFFLKPGFMVNSRKRCLPAQNLLPILIWDFSCLYIIIPILGHPSVPPAFRQVCC